MNVFQDITSGKTPVHIAVEKRDPFLLELLLSKCPGSANAPMYNDNRPLHSAATLSEVTDIQQLELVNILLKYGADKALRNKANKLPIELVQQDRDRVGYQFVCRFPWNKCALFLNFSIAVFFCLIIKTFSHWLFIDSHIRIIQCNLIVIFSFSFDDAQLRLFFHEYIHTRFSLFTFIQVKAVLQARSRQNYS